MISYTGKCNHCRHAESVHDRPGNACKHKPFIHCVNYKPQIDIEVHNTADGKPPVVLYEFQKQYLRGLPNKYIFAADTGTGKSFMALAHYDKLAYLKPLLIIAPASKVNTGDWERDIKHYFAGRLIPEYEIYSYEKFSRVPSVAQYKKTGDRGVWRDWLSRHPGGFAVISDEIHKAKNPQSKMGKAIFETTQSSDFFVGLSATPLPNGWIDAMNYFKMFGLTKNKTSFKSRYVNEQNYKGFPEIVNYYHEDELQRKWNDMAKPLDKDKALDLPSLVAVPVSLPAGSEYGKVLKQRLFEDKFLDNPSALLHALRQSITEPKIKWLDEFLEGASSNTVVFYNYKSELKAIKEMLKKNHKERTIFEQNGDTHTVPNKDGWSGLQRTITLAQYQSGSTAIEMTYADVIVYFSPTYSYSNYEQSMGRIYRNGQQSKCTLYLLCSPATIERDIWSALRQKADFSISQWYNSIEVTE